MRHTCPGRGIKHDSWLPMPAGIGNYHFHVAVCTHQLSRAQNAGKRNPSVTRQKCVHMHIKEVSCAALLYCVMAATCCSIRLAVDACILCTQAQFYAIQAAMSVLHCINACCISSKHHMPTCRKWQFGTGCGCAQRSMKTACSCHQHCNHGWCTASGSQSTALCHDCKDTQSAK